MNKIKIAVIFLLGLALFILFLVEINYEELWNALIHSRLGWILASIAAGFSGYYVRAQRWQYLLLPIKKIGRLRLFKAIVIGFTITIVLPGRLGELVRPYLIGKWEDITKSGALATIVFERIIDTLCILTYFAAYLFFFADAESASTLWKVVQKSSLVAFLVGIFGFIILFVWGNRPHIIIKIFNYILFWASAGVRERISGLIESFSSGLAVLKKPWLLAKVIIFSFIFWFTVILATSFIIWAFEPGIAFIHGIFIMVLVVLGIAVPTPGGVGTFDWAVKWGLQWLGVNENVASTIALLYHITTCAPVVLVGIAFMWHEGLRWNRIKELV